MERRGMSQTIDSAAILTDALLQSDGKVTIMDPKRELQEIQKIDEMGTFKYDEEAVKQIIEKYCRKQHVEHTLSKTRHEFDIETPMGIIRVAESKDDDYPGVVLAFVDKDGKEHSSCLMEYSKPDESIMLRIWGPDDPDGDPHLIIDMDK